MIGIRKTALASIISLVSLDAHAELKLLEDSTMRNVSGQAGLTIDLETETLVKEFAYQDGGFVLQQNMYFGGNKSDHEQAFANGSTLLDNLRLTIDLASSDSNDKFNYGFSSWAEQFAVLEDAGNTDSDILAASSNSGSAIDPENGLRIDEKRNVGDGDLVVHISATDPWQKGGGLAAYINGTGDDGSGSSTGLSGLVYSNAKSIFSRAIDYNLSWDSVGLASSDYDVGSQGIETFINPTTGQVNGTDHATGLDATAETTSLLSGINVNGYFGAIDFHIENNGNGFGADGSGFDGQIGTGNADSKIHLGAFFEVTDFDIYIDIAGVQLTDIKIHNHRGDLSSMNLDSTGTEYTSSFGFAHGQRDIYAVNETVVNTDMLMIGTNPFIDGMGHDTRFKGDVDIGALSFGDDERSIGAIYLTDYEFTQNWVISAH